MSTGHFCHWPKYYYILLGGPTIQSKGRNSWRSFPCIVGVDPDRTDGLPWFLLIPEQDMFRLVSLLKRHIWHMTTKPKSRSEAKKKENREIKSHVYAKKQTWICTTWRGFLLNCRLLFITSTKKLSIFISVLPIRIVLNSFYLLIFYSEKFSTWIWSLPFVVNATLKIN